MPWAYLAVSVIGAAFTVNAYRPRRRQSPLIVPSFFGAWLTSELAVHHIVWQAVATALFIAAGALAAWPGWLGLAITLASWVGLAYLAHGGMHAHRVTDAALDAALGPDPAGRTDPAPGTPEAGAAEADHVHVHVPVPVPVPVWSTSRLVTAWPYGHRDVVTERNLRYAPDAGKRHLLDVYRPREPVTDAPVLLQVHGGAWISGDKRHQGRPLMFHLVPRGWVCVAINYRLSPRATWPAQIVDVKLALAWIREHIASYGGDPDFVAITGGSAGGHLSALAALTPGDPEFQPGFAAADTAVQACVPFYGIYDFSPRFGGRGHDGMGGFIERAVIKRRVADDPDVFVRASPLPRVHRDAPPFMVIHGSHDSLAPVDGARAFADALRDVSRQPVVEVELPGAQHAFEVFHSPRTHHVVRAVDRFLSTVHERWAQQRSAPERPAYERSGYERSVPAPPA